MYWYQQEKIYSLFISFSFRTDNMVKKDGFDSATGSLWGKIATIRTTLSDMKNDLIQVLREENVSLKKKQN